MPEPLLQALRERVLVANGAMGSMLAAKGLKLMNSAAANLTAPDVVRAVFAEYRAAGATVFQSNTFAANGPMLRHAGLEDQHDELNRLGVALAREVVGETCYVAGNLGPTGELLRPLGLMSPEEAQTSFARQTEVFLKAGVDFILLETFEAVEELEAAVAGVRAAGSTLPLAITFSFSQPSGRSMMGVTPEQALQAMVDLGADVVGANCGLPEMTLAAVRTMSALTDRPLMMQANAGVPEIRRGETVFSGDPAQAAALATEAVTLGARLVGGCCGTNPSHIAAIAAAVAAS